MVINIIPNMQTIDFKLRFLMYLVLWYFKEKKSFVNCSCNNGWYECEISNGKSIVTGRIRRECHSIRDLYRVNFSINETKYGLVFVMDELCSDDAELIVKIYDVLSRESHAGVDSLMGVLLK